ncbi:hypothetical protein BdWA1_003002 [Babesia duncani]|uniref:Uncharacterized protein n=1 Tax=Babesia duncani TaxID=323732 RepID=A0AAD9UN24_9APIC|nr:hypothetical protein BdWA1_003002 [Babesia duncani]
MVDYTTHDSKLESVSPKLGQMYPKNLLTLNANGEWQLVRTFTESFTINAGVQNYGLMTLKTDDKIECLQQTLNRILSQHANPSICIYAEHRTFQLLKHSIKILKEYPSDYNTQCQVLRIYRKGCCALLLSDKITTRLPPCDVLIHYNMPKSLQILSKRTSPNNMNIYFYSNNEKLLMAHLQSRLKFIMKPWELPSKVELINQFVSELEAHLKNIPAIQDSGIEFVKNDPKSVLSCILYLLHRKSKAVKCKRYLLYDPSFTKFKSRQAVVDYLHGNGIYNYRSISLTRRGYIVESFDLLQLPTTHCKKLNANFIKIKRRLERGYISSPRLKRRVFAKLAKAEERKMIKALKYRNLTKEN